MADGLSGREMDMWVWARRLWQKGTLFVLFWVLKCHMYLDRKGKVNISLSGELSHLPATTFSQVQCFDDWDG
jgi:hypothetical protein